MNNVEVFKNITEQMVDTYSKKNHDYGNSFDATMDKYGLMALDLRLHDKFSRFSTLITNEAQVKDESIIDTLFDIACYCIMGIIWLMKNKCTTVLNKVLAKDTSKEDAYTQFANIVQNSIDNCTKLTFSAGYNKNGTLKHAWGKTSPFIGVPKSIAKENDRIHILWVNVTYSNGKMYGNGEVNSYYPINMIKDIII